MRAPLRHSYKPKKELLKYGTPEPIPAESRLELRRLSTQSPEDLKP